MFRFVGSQLANIGGLTINPNHEGHSGFVVRQGTGAAGSLIDVILANFFPYDPDIVILAGGTNDIDPTVNDDDPATLAASLSTELDAVFGMFTRENQQIIVFSLLKRLDVTDTKVQAYNALVPGIIAGKAYASRVWFVNIYDCVERQVVGEGYSDFVHLKNEGYNNLASVAYADSHFQSAITAAKKVAFATP